MHSILNDPCDAAPMCMAMSNGGAHESRDGGRSWSVLIDGMAVGDHAGRAGESKGND